MRYSYKVKIINPRKKSEAVMRHLPHLKTRFESVMVLRVKLAEQLGEQVPKTLTFDVGYYEGQQHSKIWLCSDMDLVAMYQKIPSGEITLWCDAKSEEEPVVSKRKREDLSTGSSKRQKKEEEVDFVFQELREKHGTTYDIPRLRLWARMVTMNLHDDLDNPPAIPAFTSTPRKSRSPLLSTVISGAATAVAKALGEGSEQKKDGDSCTSAGSSVGVSPGKAVDLRMKNYQQLRYIQQLFDDGILTKSEYLEQKKDILSSLKRL